MARRRKRICEVDMDESHYLGNGKDGVYFDAASNGKGWYASAIVDCDTGHFCGDPILTDDGPWPDRASALLAGLYAAYEWLVTNNFKGWRREYNKLAKGFRSRADRAAKETA